MQSITSLFGSAPVPAATSSTEKQDSKDQKDVKTADAKLLLAPSGRAHAMFRSGKVSRGKEKNVFYAKILDHQTLTSGANNANNAVLSLTPIATGNDWSDFSGIFDLCRVKRVVHHVNLNVSGSALSGSVSWGVAHDPANSGTYSTLKQLLEAKAHIGPIALFNNVATSPDFVSSKTGYFKFSAPLEQQRITQDATGGTAALVGGGWFGCLDATAIVAFLKPYCPALGSGVVSNIDIYTEYHCEFKWRT